MRNYALVSVFLLGIINLFSQNCNQSLTGSVIDFHQGSPLSDATITYDNVTIFTDMEGQFQISNLCKTTYTFTISHKDCEDKIVRINLAEVTNKVIYLEHHLNELQEVKVSGEARNETVSSMEQSLDTKLIEKYSSVSLGDALSEIPGVSTLKTGATISKPIIHGLNGSRILVMNNGVRMQDMEWGEEHAPSVDINSVDQITLVKGASALRYGGDAIGGVIILKPFRAKIKDTLLGKTIMTTSTNGRGGAITSSLLKSYDNGWFVKGQGSLKQFGDLEAPNYVLSNTGIKEQNFSLGFGQNKFRSGWDVYYSKYNADIAILTASHIGNVDDLIDAIDSGQPDVIKPFTYDVSNPKQDVKHHLGKIKYFKRFEELGKLSFQYDFQLSERLEFDIRRTSELSSIPAIDLLLTTHTLQSDFEFDASTKYNWSTGILFRYQDNFADPITGVRRLIPDFNRYEVGYYLVSETDISESLMLDAGVRYDFVRIDAQKFYLKSRWNARGYEVDFSDIVTDRNVIGSQLKTNPIFNYHSLSATLGLQYTFGQSNQLRFNYALSQRAPNPSELFSDGLHHSAARIELGDLRIEQEISHKFSVSLQNKSEFFNFDFSPFLNYIDNYILLEPVDANQTLRGAFPVWQYRQTNTRLLGFDTFFNVKWFENLNTTHSFSIVKGLEIDNDNPLINIPPPNITNKVTFTNKNWNNFNISLESHYHFEQNEFPSDIQVFSLRRREDVTLKINTPPDAYHLLHLDSSMDFNINDKSSIQLGFAISNIVNTPYRNYLNRQRFFADDLARNFIFRISFNY